MLRRLSDLPLIVVLMGAGVLMTLVPAIHGFADRDLATGRAFLYAALIMGLLTVLLAIATQARISGQRLRGPLTALVASYVILPAWLAFPFASAVPDTSFGHAWFEMIAAFTTTGATLYDPVDRLPDTVHLWRAMVGWSGGLFILVAASAILAPVNLGGVELTTGSVLGRGQVTGIYSGTTSHPYLRFLSASVVVLPAYVGLTMILWVGLLFSGASAVDGLCQSMSTLSTSGIRCGPLPGAGNAGLWGEFLIFAFLLVALSRRLLPGQAVTERTMALHKDPELRMAATILALFTLLMVYRSGILAEAMPVDAGPLGLIRDLWAALFTGLSYLTTHGIVSAYWSLPAPGAPSSFGLILLGLAIFGGGAATTAGGVKLLRVYALVQQGQRELERIVHPNSIGGKGQYARRLRREGAYFAWIFFLIFAVSLGGIVLGLGLFGIPFEPALVMAVATLTTTGPLITTANEVPIDLIGQSGPIKALLCVAMILGRIEILALIAVVSMGEQRR